MESDSAPRIPSTEEKKARNGIADGGTTTDDETFYLSMISGDTSMGTYTSKRWRQYSRHTCCEHCLPLSDRCII